MELGRLKFSVKKESETGKILEEMGLKWLKMRGFSGFTGVDS